MSRSTRAAQVALIAALLVGVLGVLSGHPVAAQCDPLDLLCQEPTTTSTSSPVTTSSTTSTTTLASTTSTTAAPRTSTTAPRVTTSTTAGASVVSPESSTTSTTADVPLLAEGPPLVPGADGVVSTTISTEPVADGGGDEGRTARQVTLVVTALLVLALVFGLLTYWYWRRTTPPTAPSVASPS